MSKRIDFNGAFHHIMAKAYSDQDLFDEAVDYQLFINLLGKVSQSYNLIIYSFCLMPNHVHIFAETPEANLSQAMHRLLNAYKTYRLSKFNLSEGKVYRRRFHSIIVDSQAYAQKLLRYIHLNPVKANCVSDPTEWLFSSASDYMNKTNNFNFVQKDLVYKQIEACKWIEEPALEYLIKFHKHKDGLTWDPYDNLLGNCILGDDNYFARIRNFLPQLIVDDIVNYMSIRDKVDFIMTSVDDNIDVVNDPLKAKVFLLKTFTPLTTREINQSLSTDFSAASMCYIVKRMHKCGFSSSLEALIS